MELLSVIRRWHFRDHLSIREISRRTLAGVAVQTPILPSERLDRLTVLISTEN